MKNDLLFDAIMGVIYFGVVYSLIKLVQPHGPFAVIGVLYACTFTLYYFFYKIRNIKQYITSAVMLAVIIGAFYFAGKNGVLAALGVYLIVLAWALYARRNKIKQAYKIFEQEADKVFDKKVEEKPKAVKAKKPSRTAKKNKTEHKHKQKARKKDSHKASKSSTVKKNSKKRAKKATTK